MQKSLLFLALTVAASPINRENPFMRRTHQIAPGPVSIIARDACTPGQLVCNGTDEFGLCDHGGVIFQKVATGTMCQNGQIVMGSSGAGAPPAASSGQPSAAPAAPAAPDSSPSAAPAPASTSAPAAGGLVSETNNDYKDYKGDGSKAAGWPQMSDWKSLDELFAANNDTLSQSCTQFSQPNNSPQEIDDLKSVVGDVAKAEGVDPRFAFIIIMQESKGCVRVWSTANAVVNPGLMQSHAGTGTCNDGQGGSSTSGKVLNPCPKSMITTMVEDGVKGTASGDGLKTLGATGDDAKAYYTAARKYNSGSVAADGDLSSPQSVATKCYASDVANRLTGFVGTSKCTMDTAGQ